MARKVMFGTMSKCNIKYLIVKIIPDDGTIRFVTEVETYPKKYCHWDDGKQAKFFSDKKWAEDICLGLNVNDYACFVMEVPDWFNESDFVNPAKEKEATDEKNCEKQ